MAWFSLLPVAIFFLVMGPLVIMKIITDFSWPALLLGAPLSVAFLYFGLAGGFVLLTAIVMWPRTLRTVLSLKLSDLDERVPEKIPPMERYESLRYTDDRKGIVHTSSGWRKFTGKRMYEDKEAGLNIIAWGIGTGESYIEAWPAQEIKASLIDRISQTKGSEEE